MKQNQRPNTSPIADENIAFFVENLLAEKKFENLDAEVSAQIKEDLADRVEEIINAAVLAAMPSEKLPDFEKILDNGSKEEAATFCEQNIANLQAVVTDELKSFRASYLNLDESA